MLATQAVEASLIRERDESEYDPRLLQLLNCVQDQTQIAGKKLATYESKKREVLYLTLNQMIKLPKRAPLRPLFGERYEYENGVPVGVYLSFDVTVPKPQNIKSNVKLEFPQRQLQKLRKIKTEEKEKEKEITFTTQQGVTKQLNPVCRFDQFKFEQIAKGVFVATTISIGGRLQKILSLEEHSKTKKVSASPNCSLEVVQGEAVVTMETDDDTASEYVLR